MTTQTATASTTTAPSTATTSTTVPTDTMNANSPPAAATETDVTTSATTTLATPPRHNYAATNTPIASSKRPRANTKSSSNTSPHPSSAATPAEASLSPMHPPRAAVVIVAAPDLDASSGAIMEESSQQDELFSPHLHVALPHHSAHSHNHTSDSDVESLQGIAEHSNDNDEDNNDEDDFNPWQFIQSLPPYSHVSHLVPACTIPPKRPDDTRLTLVLDLDETLVHCTTESVQDCDFTFAVVFHGTSYQVHVKLRPYLQKFLEAIENKYEVIVFTASQKVYADQLLNRIDPDNKYFAHRLFRDSCLAVEGNFLKDLTVLNRDLRHTVLVDNSPHAFGYHLENGIPIESWYEDPMDRELLKLEKFLVKDLHDATGALVPDVRSVCACKFQCRELVDRAPAYGQAQAK